MLWNSSALFIILSYTHPELYLSRAGISSFTLTMQRWAGNGRRRQENLPKTILALLQHSCVSLTCSISLFLTILLPYWGRPSQSWKTLMEKRPCLSLPAGPSFAIAGWTHQKPRPECTNPHTWLGLMQEPPAPSRVGWREALPIKQTP